MYSKAKIAGHPIHPMLVGFPITFYVMTFLGFLTYQTISSDIFWFKLGYFCNFAAVITALVAAVPGFIDWALGIPNQTQAKRRGLTHMVLNLITLGLYAINAYLISGSWNTGDIGLGTSLFLSAVGLIFLTGAGYYGWEMIGRYKVGVDMSAEQERLEERYEEKQPPLYH
ncbi:DUF2231 domain-containing protein [Bdellovibrio sp.]|uniref:DUF2231 domain-containing protein n=1 Tax=Bdellovibrio sp. TaxID=28201 RepID=UPI0039E4F9D7